MLTHKRARLRNVFIALPVMNEFENLPKVIECFKNQVFEGRIVLYVCVNQPDEWWEMPDKIQVCLDNQASIKFLQHLGHPDIKVIDRSSKGLGWSGKKHGVGYARREVIEAINQVANDDDILISLDADTIFESEYVSHIYRAITSEKSITAIAVPYYHRLTGNEIVDRAILRYEIYMRCYIINLMKINSPYSFTALGSAIALPIKAYRSIGGITPKMSGEDFYFLQKLRKKGPVLTWLPDKVYPAARFSDRVYFGTGPALIKGATGNWDSYPIYPLKSFQQLENLYKLFPRLYYADEPTPLDHFIQELFGNTMIWSELRKTSRTIQRFIRACHEKFDGLRILQYLKWSQQQNFSSDEENLLQMLEYYFDDFQNLPLAELRDKGFSTSSITSLDAVRNYLEEKENCLRRKISQIRGDEAVTR